MGSNLLTQRIFIPVSNLWKREKLILKELEQQETCKFICIHIHALLLPHCDNKRRLSPPRTPIFYLLQILFCTAFSPWFRTSRFIPSLPLLCVFHLLLLLTCSQQYLNLFRICLSWEGPSEIWASTLLLFYSSFSHLSFMKALSTFPFSCSFLISFQSDFASLIH